jgi:hypothetical protein
MEMTVKMYAIESEMLCRMNPGRDWDSTAMDDAPHLPPTCIIWEKCACHSTTTVQHTFHINTIFPSITRTSTTLHYHRTVTSTTLNTSLVISGYHQAVPTDTIEKASLMIP